MIFIFIPALLVSKYVFFYLGVQVDASSLSSETALEKDGLFDLDVSMSLSNKGSEHNSKVNKIDDTKEQKIKKGYKRRKKQRRDEKKKKEKLQRVDYNNSRRRHGYRKKDKKRISYFDFINNLISNFSKQKSSLATVSPVEMKQITVILGKQSYSKTHSYDKASNHESNERSLEKLKILNQIATKKSYQNIKSKIKKKQKKKYEKLVKNHNIANGNPKQKLKRNKSIGEGLILKNAYFEVFVPSSMPKRKNTNIPDTVASLAPDIENTGKKSRLKKNRHHHKKRIKSKFQDLFKFETLKKTTEQRMFRQRSYQTNLTDTAADLKNKVNNPDLHNKKDIKSKLLDFSSFETSIKTPEESQYRQRSHQNLSNIITLIPDINVFTIENEQQAQNIKSNDPIPTFAAIDSRLKFITEGINDMEYVNNFTKTQHMELRLFSGPYNVSSTVAPNEDNMNDTDSLEKENRIFLVNKKKITPESKEVTYNSDMKHVFEKIIDEILREGEDPKEELKDDQVKLNSKEIDALFEIEIRKGKEFSGKISRSGGETSIEKFSALEDLSNETNFRVLKRFSIISGENIDKSKNNNSNDAVTIQPQPDVTVIGDGEDVTIWFHGDDLKNSTDGGSKQTPESNILKYVSSYFDEKDLITNVTKKDSKSSI